ncbi:MAG TPA: SH3 domain-containing protein [Anaerolineales bacterium]|nr:SH3 domain-containing protein [Anaerolineales bacterium]
MNPSFRFAIVIFLLSAGCTAAPFGRTEVPTARPLTSTPVPTATETPSPTPTATATPVPTATASPIASPSPTATITPTHTPAPLVAVIANQYSNIYSGPGSDYTLLAILSAGLHVEVVGAAPGGGWLIVRLPRGAHGWVAVVNLEPVADAGIPVMTAPPKPPPTATSVAAPLVIVSPGALAPGGKYTISFLHFQPQERITVKITAAFGASTLLKTVLPARFDGTTELILATGAGTAAGLYVVTATGDDGSFAETQLYVGPPP